MKRRVFFASGGEGNFGYGLDGGIHVSIVDVERERAHFAREIQWRHWTPGGFCGCEPK